MRTLITYFVFLSVSLGAHCAELDSTEAIDRLVEDLVKLVGEGKPSQAMSLLKPHLVIPESEFDVALGKLKLQQPMLDQRFGQTVGAELIGTKHYGDSFLQITFLQKYERHSMRWRIWFYKPVEKWVLSTFQTDDSVQCWF